MNEKSYNKLAVVIAAKAREHTTNLRKIMEAIDTISAFSPRLDTDVLKQMDMLADAANQQLYELQRLLNPHVGDGERHEVN